MYSLSLLNVQGHGNKRHNKLHSPELLKLFKITTLIAFTETWSDAYTNLYVEHFTHFALHRPCRGNAKRNSGGLMVYVKDTLSRDVTLYSENTDSYLWLKMNGSLFDLKYDLYVCISYIIPENSSRQAFTESNVFNDIFDDMTKLTSKYK